MQKWDFLHIFLYVDNIVIRSSDPDEVAVFCDIISKRFPGRDKIKISPDGYCAEFSGYGITHALIRSSTKRKPHIVDVQYSLIIKARERNWEPHDGIEIFIRYSEPKEITKECSVET